MPVTVMLIHATWSGVTTFPLSFISLTSMIYDCACGGICVMEAMLNAGVLDANVSTGSVWDKLCLAFPILASNVRACYMSGE